MSLDDDELQDLLRKCGARLHEHFDTVQVFCTKEGTESTAVHQHGVGCWYTRLAVTREFARVEEAIAMRARIRHAEEEDEETA